MSKHIQTASGLLVSAPPELTPGDFILHETGAGTRTGGIFQTNIIRNGKELGWQNDHNLITTVGLNNILDSTFGGSTPTATWYVALFANNVTPAAGDTSADIGVKYTELTQYAEATREVWTKDAAASGGVITNSAARCEYNITDTVTAYGSIFISTSTKGSATGLFGAASLFSVSRPLISGDILLVQYTITATST
jgi:hypothetical protein